MLDVWIVIDDTTWAGIAPDDDAEPQSWHAPYRSAITGYWAQSVYNVVGEFAEIDALINQLGNPTAYCWTQGDGRDNEAWPTDPQPILNLMKPHQEYNEAGKVIGTHPATFDWPNWGHVFFGQKQRRFAGQFSEQFSDQFA